MKPMQIPSDGGKKVNILGIPMVIRLHHREDETFQILEGDYEFTVDGKSFVAKKGTTIFAPRGIPHTYRYLGQEPGRLMCVITPAGFEGFFEEIGALSSQQQQEIPRV